MSNMSIVCEAHVTQSPVCSHLRWRVVTSTDEKFAIQMPHHGREWVPQTPPGRLSKCSQVTAIPDSPC